MLPIDQIQPHFNPGALQLLNVILAFIVFGVSLDIKVSDLKEITRSPKPFLVGICSQFLIFPAIAFLAMFFLAPGPSIALGMILVAACPGGNISNFMAQLAKGNTALSIAMSAFSTALAIIMTPFNFTFWGSKIPGGNEIMKQVELNPLEMFYMILVLMLIPLTLGIFITHRFPIFAKKLKKGMKLFSLLFFLAFLGYAIADNLWMIKAVGWMVPLSVILLNFLAYLFGYSLAGIFRLKERERRTVAIETGIQNAGLGLILVYNVFDGLGGLAVVAALWGVWHIFSGLVLSFYWSRN